MAYTDQTTLWVYKKLLIWQDFDAAAENDALFQNRFLGTELIPGPMKQTASPTLPEHLARKDYVDTSSILYALIF